MEILIPQTLPGDDVVAVIGLSPAEAEALLAAGRWSIRKAIAKAIGGAIDVGHEEACTPPCDGTALLGRVRIEVLPEYRRIKDTIVKIDLEPSEAAALLAAGRAAGCIDLESVVHGVIDDAIGIGCRILRMEEDAAFEREARGVQAA